MSEIIDGQNQNFETYERNYKSQQVKDELLISSFCVRNFTMDIVFTNYVQTQFEHPVTGISFGCASQSMEYKIGLKCQKGT